jgi:hypothetical protein
MRSLASSSVALSEQHVDVLLRGHDESEVDGRERLALTRHRARHHDEVCAGHAVRAPSHRVRDEGTLDLAILLGDLPGLVLRGQQAGRAQRILIDGDDALGHHGGARVSGACDTGVHDLPVHGLAGLGTHTAGSRRFRAATRLPHLFQCLFDETHDVPSVGRVLKRPAGARTARRGPP